MIRRLKKDVLAQLPPKKRQNVEIECNSKLIKQIKAVLGKLPDIDIDFEEKEIEINSVDIENNKEENIFSGFSKAYKLTGLSKLDGIKKYVSYLLESIY